jgi:glycerophosphoryl diester phosphodiesterase
MKIMRLSGLLSIFICASCQKNKDVPVPETQWDIYDNSTQWADISTLEAIEGVYAITNGTNDFGTIAAAKTSYTIEGADTIYHITFLCEKDASYLVLQGKINEGVLLLKGYWRNMHGEETGTIHVKKIINSGTVPTDSLQNNAISHHIITGTWGDDDEVPAKKLELKYLRPLYNKTPFVVLAHRGGGRNTDYVPSSENSVELIKKAARFGATGVEIDVQLTKDKVPILYHDARINGRLTKETGIHRKITSYTYKELLEEITLTKDEKIPKVEQALKAIVHETSLDFVWLDCKDETALLQLKDLQRKYIDEAASIGRNVSIMIGIHGSKAMKALQEIPGHKNIPTICELDPEDAIELNSEVWAPMWIKRGSKEDVIKMQGKGKKVFIWTVDNASKVKKYITESGYDGVLSNYPSVVAFYHYTRQ